MNIICPTCRTEWRQRGNATGHCSGCHRTFHGLSAFDGHFTRDRSGGPVCNDPASLRRPDGSAQAWWVDSSGHWYKGARMTDAARERVSGGRGGASGH